MPKIVIEVERATETFPGAILEGHYDLVDDEVIVTDLHGRPIGKEEVKSGDDPAVTARRILRRARQGNSDLHSPIRYPPLSIV
jgi:hypothetical protein